MIHCVVMLWESRHSHTLIITMNTVNWNSLYGTMGNLATTVKVTNALPFDLVY